MIGIVGYILVWKFSVNFRFQGGIINWRFEAEKHGCLVTNFLKLQHNSTLKCLKSVKKWAVVSTGFWGPTVFIYIHKSR